MELSFRGPQFSPLKIRHYARLYYITIPQKFCPPPVTLGMIVGDLNTHSAFSLLITIPPHHFRGDLHAIVTFQQVDFLT